MADPVVDVLAQDFFACIDEQGDNPHNSIIGAHYCLEVRHLLQTKTDSETKKQDYIEVVRRVANDFLAGVQRNIRTRIFTFENLSKQPSAKPPANQY